MRERENVREGAEKQSSNQQSEHIILKQVLGKKPYKIRQAWSEGPDGMHSASVSDASGNAY